MSSLPKNQRSTQAGVTLDRGVLYGSGMWTVFYLQAVEQLLSNLPLPSAGAFHIDMQNVSTLDTAGAWLLYRTVYQQTQRGLSVSVAGLSPQAQMLYEYVSRRGGVPGQLPEANKTGVIEGIGRSGVKELNKKGLTQIMQFFVLSDYAKKSFKQV